MSFELRNLAADRCKGHSELSRGGRKASNLDSGHEGGHRYNSVHNTFQEMEGWLPIILDTTDYRKRLRPRVAVIRAHKRGDVTQSFSSDVAFTPTVKALQI